MEALGRHILVEFWLCNPDILNDVPAIENSMVKGATKASATVINSHFHHFSPWGVSGVVIIQESHLAIHTWPEYQYAAADLFTCGDDVDPWVIFDHMKDALESKNYSVLEMHRGPENLLTRIPYETEGFREIVKERMHLTPDKRSIWFTDKDENMALSIRSSGQLLFDKSSDFQRVRVFDSFGFGKALTIDNMIMCTEKDEAHYHEMIAHPACLAFGKPERVLVIGGGDGGTVREVLKHESVKEVVMVEIDELVVEASRNHLPRLSAEFDNPRLQLIIGDGIKYVQETESESFDLILVDGSDPVGPAEGLFSEEFYRNCNRVLTEQGILVTQGESPTFNSEVFVELNHCLKNIFKKENVEVMLFYIPTYPSGLWSFQVAMKGEGSLATLPVDKIKEFTSIHRLGYYNADIHYGSLALPEYVGRLLAEGS